MMECGTLLQPGQEINVDIDLPEGTSNDSWTGGSIVSQLNPDILKKIRNCFQVKYYPYLRYVLSLESNVLLNTPTAHSALCSSL